jgi:hypothetical protein
VVLFQDALVCVKINGAHTKAFSIGRGVRQGCPLGPYLFLIVAEVMNAMIKTKVAARVIKGIKLHGGTRQHVIAQYVDDTSLTLLEEESLRCLIYILETFHFSSGLVLNWNKSSGYWKFVNDNPRPRWTDFMHITRVENDEVNKLLGLVLTK